MNSSADQPTPSTDTSTSITIRVAADEDASRVSAVLEALGYTVHRDLIEGEAPARLAWAVDRLGDDLQLTPRERDVLAGILDGLDNERLAVALGVRKATVKWHLHNVFAKANVGHREGLLRLALQLGVPTPLIKHEPQAPIALAEVGASDFEDPRHQAGPDDITRRIE